MSVTLKITDEYELDESAEIEQNEVDKNSMGGTELMKYGLHERLDAETLEPFQIICSRYRGTKKGKKPIYWLHDLPGDPESEHLRNEGWEKFEKLVFVSNWQLQQYHNYYGVPYRNSVVMQNAIDPIEEHEKPDDGTIRLIYHSTPHRGLQILVPVFEKLSEMFDNIELDVYSSFKLYGWEERDEPYRELFKACEEHPKIHYHGSVSNDEIREALKRADIFAYPSMWQETSCICLLEAMSAGLMCVHSNLAALPETAANWTYMYQYSEEINEHANRFAQHLAEAIQLVQQPAMKQRLKMQKTYTDSFYNWNVRAQQWKLLLDDLAN